ncbi:MAG: TonB-dependent receptor plug domain-containing protein, partial [Thiomicrorhabdus sp.]|nr:TonB-dependent receptor plug domain-containing protein [Thiomicrorhabdus sp.]
MKLSKISAAILLAALSNPQAVFATEIGNIVVTANNAKQNLASVTAKTEVITEQDIEEKQFQTLKDALQTVPGINLYNSGGPFLGTQIQIRGSSNSQVLIMVDGISINDPIGFGANLDNISLQDIAQIEIIKSPQAGIWGANAAAGVINIITKSGQNSQQGNFSVEKGSFNSIKIASTLTAKSEQADFSLSISHKSSNGYSSIILKDDDVNKNESDGYSQTDIGFNTGFNLTKDHRIELLFKDTNTESDYDAYGFPSDPNDVNSNVTLSSQLKKLQYVFQNDQLKARAYLSR